VVVGWLTRVALVLTVLGVLLFDGSALLVGRVSTADAADAAAQAAADSWRTQHNYATALAAAQSAAGDSDVVPNSLTVATDGATHLRVHHEVSTLVVRRLPHADRFVSVTAEGQGRPPLS
jgi:Flp pilus assembly protein TadG